MRILITGGAGFVGSRLAHLFVESHPGVQVHVLDNLKRRGSESNLAPFKKLGIEFFHGDVRNAEDFTALRGEYDALVDCSAEPSVHAGTSGGPRGVVDTNLYGTLNCLEYARQHSRGVVFLSTSRVYSVAALRQLNLTEENTRLSLPADCRGIDETFATNSFRTFYGTSKLASEQLLQEYAEFYGLPCVINRCSNLAGAGQFGKVDQGIFVYWLVSHVLGKGLKYTGFGGTGKQVRDILHPADLFALVDKQIAQLSNLRADIFNVGGGLQNSLSLRELTSLCADATGNSVPITPVAETSKVDIPYFVADHSKATQRFGWTPSRTVNTILSETHHWLMEDKNRLAALFG